MPNGDLISRSAALAAMHKAVKQPAFNPFKVLDEAPEAEAVTLDELQAAIIDMNTYCRGNICSKCDYDKARVCSIDDPENTDVRELIRVYRKRKEAGK